MTIPGSYVDTETGRRTMLVPFSSDAYVMTYPGSKTGEIIYSEYVRCLQNRNVRVRHSVGLAELAFDPSPLLVPNIPDRASVKGRITIDPGSMWLCALAPALSMKHLITCCNTRDGYCGILLD